MTPARVMSVVVGLIAGRTANLRRCLGALHEQDIDATLDIIVPYDDPCRDVTTLAGEFPKVRFIRADGLDTEQARQGGSREHHDALRTIGLRAATGDVIALTEDHAVVDRSWCREMTAALDRHPAAAAIGGAVECESDRSLMWAVWFCDFGRYQNPLPDGRAEYVSDSNVAYRRRALETVAPAWQDDYHETAVHWAMTAAGFELRTTPAVVVWQARPPLHLKDALRERYVWARSFAGTRARGLGARRWVLAAFSPLLPLLMTWRLFGVTRQRQKHLRRFVEVLPYIVMLQSVWAAGELVGYVSRDPG